jgi:type VI secretion system secreted protein Hcp
MEDSVMRKLFLFSAISASALLVLWVQGGLVSAGPLDPPGAPASSTVTLNQLGEQLDRIESSRFMQSPFPSATDAAIAGSVLLFIEDIDGPIDRGEDGAAIGVLGFSHEVISPRDAASGLPTGKRQHKPVVVTKRIDKSTPLLYQGIVTNKNFPTVRLEFYQRNDTGEVENYYTILLTNASIASVRSESPHFEEISFVYQKIEWTFEDGGVTAEDDWESPVT